MAISFKGAHFPPEVILLGVRWYLAYPLSTNLAKARLCWLSHLNKELPGVTADAAPTAQSIPAFVGVRLAVRP